MLDENKIKLWWNSVKDSDLWSGAIVGLEWDELWPEAKESIMQIADKLDQLNSEE